MHLPGGVFHKDSFSLQLHKQLTSTQVLQNQVQLTTSLECIDEVDDERMLFNNIQQTTGFDLPLQQWSLLNRFCTEQGHCSACRRKWRLTDCQTLICVLVARPRRCLTLSNPVP